MYTDFYGLKEKPFNLTPSPRFLYLGEVHKEALALLSYGVAERKGFILLTGEVGTGKTTMVQALLESLDEDVECVHLSNPLLTQQDFIDYLAFSAFKKKAHFKSKTEFLFEFEEYLKECLHRQKNFVLIVDEAQKLSFDILEEIRLLSNMETSDEKLINIFLVGQPELNEKLRTPECRALRQRISVRYHIRPLDLDATREYVLTRLEIAGGKQAQKIFSDSAIKALFTCSGGFPRVINIVADNALLLGYAKEKRKISPAMVEECHKDLQIQDTGQEGAPVKDDPLSRSARRGGNRRLWVLATALAAVLVLFALNWRGVLETLVQTIPAAASRLQASIQERLRSPASTSAPVEKENNRVSERIPAASAPTLAPPLEKPPAKKEKVVIADLDAPDQAATKPLLPPPSPQREDRSGRDVGPPIQQEKAQTVTVQKGDTVTELAAKVYGLVDEKVLDMLANHNPHIPNLDFISVGQKITFPPLSAEKIKYGLTYTVHVASFKPFDAARVFFQKMVELGYEPYIIPVYDAGKGKMYRVTLANFESREKAQEYADVIVQKGISDYATPVLLEMK